MIAFPWTVTGLLDKPVDVDLNKVKIEVPQIELPPLDFGQPNRSSTLPAAAQRCRNTPNEARRVPKPRSFRSGRLLGACRLSLRSVTHHEAVEADFGDLEPLIAVVARSRVSDA